MNYITSYIKELGIVFSYISFSVACFYFEWNPFGIFMFYLIEVVVLLLIYAILRIKDEKEDPRRYRKSQSIVNLFIGITPMIIFQYFIIGWTSLSINPEQNFIESNLFFSKEVFFMTISIVVLYSVKAFQVTNQQEKLRVFQQDFLFQVLMLSGANTLGFFVVLGLGVNSLFITLIIMVAFRMFVEFYFARKMKTD